MFFQEKVETSEIIKWGVFAGLLEGAYIGIATVLYAQKGVITVLSDGWPQATLLFLMFLIVISAIVTSVIVFAHPLYSMMQKKYQEAFLTLGATLVTLIAILGFMLYIFRQLFT